MLVFLLGLTLSVSATSVMEDDFDIEVSTRTSGQTVELILKSELPITNESDRIRFIQLAEVYSFAHCGARQEFPEVKMQKVEPAEKKITSLTRNFECAPLADKKIRAGYLRMIQEECAEKELLQKMKDACAKAKPHLLTLKE